MSNKSCNFPRIKQAAQRNIFSTAYSLYRIFQHSDLRDCWETPKSQLGPKSFIYQELNSALYKDLVGKGFPREWGWGPKHSLLRLLSRCFWISGSVHGALDLTPGQTGDVREHSGSCALTWSRWWWLTGVCFLISSPCSHGGNCLPFESEPMKSWSVSLN